MASSFETTMGVRKGQNIIPKMENGGRFTVLTSSLFQDRLQESFQLLLANSLLLIPVQKPGTNWDLWMPRKRIILIQGSRELICLANLSQSLPDTLRFSEISLIKRNQYLMLKPIPADAVRSTAHLSKTCFIFHTHLCLPVGPPEPKHINHYTSC